MKILLAFFSIAVLSFSASAQTFTNSNLPIVIIGTDMDPNTKEPIEIPDDPKVLATMKIIYRPDSSRNYLSDEGNPTFLNYNGRIGIEVRGSSSQLLPKKQYGFNTLQNDNTSNNNVSLLGMPKENDWILNALDFDSSLVRNYLSYELARSMGNYAARGRYCEVILNGDYKGLYVLYEKLKIETERINILKQENNSTNITGGYITKADKTTGGDPVAWVTSSNNTNGPLVIYVHESPKPEDITTQQNAYIKSQFDALQSLLTAKNASIANGYPSIIDVPSFVDFILLNEFASNADAYQFSTFFHKDRNGKLRAGPVWDLNLTYGNDIAMWKLDRSKTDVWQFDNGDNTGSKFWKDLYEEANFKCYLAKRWKEVSGPLQAFDYVNLSSRIDQIVAHISEAALREEERWKTVGNHAKHISALKTWMQTRKEWLSTRLYNSQACANPVLPPLVISKIHYNPLFTRENGSNDLEFIEITNNGNQSVDVTGLYFRELGITYQFPANQSVGAHQTLYLASNAAVFEQYYGVAPFGQFTRNLSNKSQKLVLADAYGNIIDAVEYQDAEPWPTETDGEGPYLQLTDVDSDNSLASSWAPSTLPVGLEENELATTLQVYPNPAQHAITVSSTRFDIDSYEILDLLGTKRLTGNKLDGNLHRIDLEELPANTYLLKVKDKEGRSFVKKIIKL